MEKELDKKILALHKALDEKLNALRQQRIDEEHWIKEKFRKLDEIARMECQLEINNLLDDNNGLL